MSFLKKRVCSSSPEVNGGGCAVGADDAARWPALLEFLTAGVWPDGTSRIPGSLVLFVEEGRLKMCLSDRAQGTVAFLTGQEVLGLLDGCEAQLRDGTGDWRPTRSQGKGLRR
jgi:hypothetical protein